MGFSSQHPAKLWLTGLLFTLCILLAVNYGDLKVAADIDWMDILGEGSSLAVVIAWLLLVLYSTSNNQAITTARLLPSPRISIQSMSAATFKSP